MIISMVAEKVIAKIQHIFMIKIIENIGLKGTYLNLIKAIYKKPIGAP